MKINMLVDLFLDLFGELRILNFNISLVPLLEFLLHTAVDIHDLTASFVLFLLGHDVMLADDLVELFESGKADCIIRWTHLLIFERIYLYNLDLKIVPVLEKITFTHQIFKIQNCL